MKASVSAAASVMSESVKGLTLLDLGVHYEKNGYRASLLVQNLTDKEYISSCSTFGCYYGDGRTVMGKLTYRW